MMTSSKMRGSACARWTCGLAVAFFLEGCGALVGSSGSAYLAAGNESDGGVSDDGGSSNSPTPSNGDGGGTSPASASLNDASFSDGASYTPLALLSDDAAAADGGLWLTIEPRDYIVTAPGSFDVFVVNSGDSPTPPLEIQLAGNASEFVITSTDCDMSLAPFMGCRISLSARATSREQTALLAVGAAGTYFFAALDALPAVPVPSGSGNFAGGPPDAATTGGGPPDAGFAAEGGGGPGGPATIPTSTCPATPPPSGYPCGGTVMCSYGSVARIDCRAVYGCFVVAGQPAKPGELGSWIAETPSIRAATACPTDSMCPAAAPTNNGTCPPGARCGYPDGTLSFCTAAGTWVTTPPPPLAQCPSIAPNEGTPCPQPGVSCNYGAYCAGDPFGLQASCGTNGWQWSYCPGTGG